MTTRPTVSSAVSTLVFVLAALMTGLSPAAEGVPLLKDLTATLKLLNLPCGQVISARRQAENDQVAICSDGNRYRVYVNRDGRVVAEKN